VQPLHLVASTASLGEPHPTAPAPVLQEEVVAFLQSHVFVQQDQDYVTFLETYAGATIFRGDTLYIDIFGFSDVGLHITKEDSQIIDDDGWFCFCKICTYFGEGYQSLRFKEIDFAFDITGKRNWGIYRSIANSQRMPKLHWHCATFLELLQEIITTDWEQL